MTPTLAPLRGPTVVPRGGGGPALLAVAHGSRDPRSAATMAAVVAEIAAARPDRTVRLAFLDLSTPSVDQVVDNLATQGHRDVIVVPLLLGNAFHARVDLPALLAEAARRHPRLRFTQADVLGPDPLLIAALSDRVTAVSRHPVTASVDRAQSPAAPASRGFSAPATAQPAQLAPASAHPAPTSAPPSPAGAPQASPPAPLSSGTRFPTGLGIAVAAVGSRDQAANARTAAVAERLAAMTGLPTEICFATAEPGVELAAVRLRARGAERIVVAPWFLAPGLLTDRLLAAAPDLVHAEVIGSHPALTEVVWARYDSVIAAELELSA
ncbi:sirohydrochlorin chelatase [Nocardia sp. SSK8]|uniref:sirohydrochlorin chelatase n=1 Tax=Nocardia sp. SSK8 TaxID=3120154 RepID=UPI0030091C60